MNRLPQVIESVAAFPNDSGRDSRRYRLRRVPFALPGFRDHAAM